MTIQDLGSIGELVAAIATIATLVYLARQIRENTKAVRSESRGRLSSQSVTYASVIGGSKETAGIFTRGLRDRSSLSSEEKTQFDFLFSMVVNQTQDNHHEYGLGMTDRESLEAHARQTFRMLQTPGGRAWWQRHAVSFNPGFQEFVNAALREAQGDSD